MGTTTSGRVEWSCVGVERSAILQNRSRYSNCKYFSIVDSCKWIFDVSGFQKVQMLEDSLDLTLTNGSAGKFLRKKFLGKIWVGG